MGRGGNRGWGVRGDGEGGKGIMVMVKLSPLIDVGVNEQHHGRVFYHHLGH